ncbi:P-loop NTPase [Natrarchaeobius sp. A-rgal3]|uniref:DUF7125 family protein n=1 Tax=Natrarchaeobius versutus TaxID=1679078 RepID=UPI00350F331A
MIAIAGSKGGCGKSTVTLGLAEAFARSDTPALAIDADRQLPNLHVVTELEREPTLASVDENTDVREIAQQHPREPNVGVVPAPKSSEAFEFDRVSEFLSTDGIQVLIDCPSGAGPSVVDPIRQAEGLIVVASGTVRSLEAAETTVEMARRLGVPIYGAVLNKCDEIPDQAARWDGVPILGCIPQRTTPLVNDDVAAAFDDVVDRLASQSPTDRAPPEYADGRLPTGVDAVDRQLGGGVEPGSIVAVVADPASHGEHLLHRATGVRGTLYLSTERGRATVRRALESSAAAAGTPTVRQVSGESAFEEATSLIGKLPHAANLIVDPVDPFERRDRAAYVSFLDTLDERMAETESVAILHCLEETPNRSATLHAADAVFELETVAPGAGTDVEHYLSVPKYRPDPSVTGTIELALEDGRTVAPIESPPGTDRE